MKENDKNLSSKELALYFIANSNKEDLISDVFTYLNFNDSMRSYLDNSRLNDLIDSVNEAQTPDVQSLADIISMIREGKRISTYGDKELLRDIKDYIDKHFSEDESISDIARAMHISYYYLCHFFKRQMGISIIAYRNNKRIEKAMRLLTGENVKISDVASECGFNNSSYFTEMFGRYVGVTPSEFRAQQAGKYFHDFYGLADMHLAAKMPFKRFLKSELKQVNSDSISCKSIQDPGEEYGYHLHEAAIIEYEGVLYTSWYHCPEKEYVGATATYGKRSCDGGNTWSDIELIAEDKDGGMLCKPPVYGICDGKLYMFINQMVSGDNMHSLDLFVLNKETDRFELVWSRPIPFKVNTNVVKLPNGKLMLTGRIADMDQHPYTPAVLISDSGKIDADWRLVKVAPSGALPDGTVLIHPETTVICNDGTLYLFNRNDQRRVPLVYTSADMGESWSQAASHDIPYVNSKIYAGTLSDGRHYLIANVDNFDRSKLSVFFTAKNSIIFEEELTLFECECEIDGMIKCYYPSAVESDGTLYIIATAEYKSDELKGSGALLFKLGLDK